MNFPMTIRAQNLAFLKFPQNPLNRIPVRNHFRNTALFLTNPMMKINCSNMALPTLRTFQLRLIIPKPFSNTQFSPPNMRLLRFFIFSIPPSSACIFLFNILVRHKNLRYPTYIKFVHHNTTFKTPPFLNII